MNLQLAVQYDANLFPRFQDIASKIMAFSQQGPRTVCILSANGAICNVTLRQPAMGGGTVSYEVCMHLPLRQFLFHYLSSYSFTYRACAPELMGACSKVSAFPSYIHTFT